MSVPGSQIFWKLFPEPQNSNATQARVLAWRWWGLIRVLRFLKIKKTFLPINPGIMRFLEVGTQHWRKGATDWEAADFTDGFKDSQIMSVKSLPFFFFLSLLSSSLHLMGSKGSIQMFYIISVNCNTRSNLPICQWAMYYFKKFSD